jgi:hypothetical protein
MAHVVPDDEQPTMGYKMVALPSGQAGIATLSIPTKSTVIRTSYQVAYRNMPDADPAFLLRTDKVIVCKIVPLGRPKEIVMKAQSTRSKKLQYNLGKATEMTLGHPDAADGHGVHFFESERHAQMWQLLLKK